MKPQNFPRLLEIADTETPPEYPVHYPPPSAWIESGESGAILESWKKAAKDMSQDMVLYVHVPFCENICRFCGFYAQKLCKPAEIPAYLRLVDKEAGFYSGILSRRRFMWLCVGGGTPSIMSAKEIGVFFGILKKHFDFLPGVRIAVESHPDTLDPEKIGKLKECGVDWLAIGVESLDEDVLVRNGRPQDNSRIPGLVRDAKRAGIKNIQIDLIAGLPFQTRESFLRDVETVAELNPERIYLFPFQSKDRVALKLEKGNPQWLWEAYRQAVNKLCSAGYELSCGRWVYKGTGGDWPYSYDQGERASDKFYSILGIGPGAISYARNGVRYQNCAPMNVYRRRLENGRLPVARQVALTKKDEMINFILLNLLHKGVCSAREFRTIFGAGINNVFKTALGNLKKQGALSCIGGKYYLENRASGLFSLRNELYEPEVVQRIFQRHLRQLEPGVESPGGPAVPDGPATRARQSFTEGGGQAPTLNAFDSSVFECHPTYECNADCLFCYNGPASRDRASIKSLQKELFIEHKQNGKTAVVFSGGEPTLFGDLPELIRFAKKLGYGAIALATNGMRLKDADYFKNLAGCGLNGIELSVHASSPALHNKITRCRQSWDGIMGALANALKIKVGVRINCVVNKHNISVLPDMVRFFVGGFAVTDFRFIMLKTQHLSRRQIAQLCPKWEDAAKALEPVFETAGKNCRIRLVNLPACVKPEWAAFMEDVIGKDRTPTLPDPHQTRGRDSLEGGGTPEPGVFESGGLKPRACKDCLLQLNCPGVDKGYVAYYGEAGIRPVTSVKSDMQKKYG